MLSEAGVGAVPPTTAARIFVDNAGTRTGVALASPANPELTVVLRLTDRQGFELGETTVNLSAQGHLARFADELFPDHVIEGFSGLMEIQSSEPIVPITLKLTVNERDDPVLTTLPVADLEAPLGTTALVFPQLGFGDFGTGLFATRLILLNRDLETMSTGSIEFFQSEYMPMMLPLLGDVVSETAYQVLAGGAVQLRPGNTEQVSQIILNPQDPSGAEIVLNAGGSLVMRPQVVDSAADVRDDFQLSFLSLNSDVATVDEQGKIEGKKAGFSTLTLSAGGLIRSATITVVQVTSGTAGFGVTGLTRDLANRLYLSDTDNHTILLAGGPTEYSCRLRRSRRDLGAEE